MTKDGQTNANANAGFDISQDTAEQQVATFLDFYDIDLEEYEDEQLQALELACKKIVKMIRRGRVTINTDTGCKVEHTTSSGKVFIYKELSGMAKTEMGKRKENDVNGRLYALMGSLSGTGFTAVAKLEGQDMAIAECFGVLFLLV